MKINSLTHAEEQLMMVLWNLHTFYMKDVMEQHPDPKPHQNTVSTYLKILLEKGYLSAEKEGRINRYTISVTADAYKKFMMKELFGKFYKNSGTEILQFLLDEKMITQQDLLTFFDLKIELKPIEEEIPLHPIADIILNPTSDKKKKKKKKKGKKRKGK